jgi:hypothetical protein
LPDCLNTGILRWCSLWKIFFKISTSRLQYWINSCTFPALHSVGASSLCPEQTITISIRFHFKLIQFTTPALYCIYLVWQGCHDYSLPCLPIWLGGQKCPASVIQIEHLHVPLNHIATMREILPEDSHIKWVVLNNNDRSAVL